MKNYKRECYILLSKNDFIDAIEEKFFKEFGYNTNELHRKLYKLLFWQCKDFDELSSSNKNDTFYTFFSELVLRKQPLEICETLKRFSKEQYDIELTQSTLDLIYKECSTLTQALDNCISLQLDELLTCKYTDNLSNAILHTLELRHVTLFSDDVLNKAKKLYNCIAAGLIDELGDYYPSDINVIISLFAADRVYDFDVFLESKWNFTINSDYSPSSILSLGDLSKYVYHENDTFERIYRRYYIENIYNNSSMALFAKNKFKELNEKFRILDKDN